MPAILRGGILQSKPNQKYLMRYGRKKRREVCRRAGSWEQSLSPGFYACLSPRPITVLTLFSSPLVRGCLRQKADKDMRWWRGSTSSRLSRTYWTNLWSYPQSSPEQAGQRDEWELLQLLPGPPLSPDPVPSCSPHTVPLVAFCLRGLPCDLPDALREQWLDTVDCTQVTIPEPWVDLTSFSISGKEFSNKNHIWKRKS